VGIRRRGATVTTAAAAAWPKVVEGVRTWKGIKFDEFSFEVKKSADGAAAQRLINEFVASDGLTQTFCENAVDVTFLAYKQGRPPDELMMLQELATQCMKEHRRRVSTPETFFMDEVLKKFTTIDDAAAKAGDAAAAQKLAGVRAMIRLYFVDGVVPPPGRSRSDGKLEQPGTPQVLDKSTFLTRLEQVRNRCQEDAKREKSMAFTNMNADEASVQGFMDPMKELHVSGLALTETYKRIEVLQRMFQQEVFGSGFNEP